MLFEISLCYYVHSLYNYSSLPGIELIGRFNNKRQANWPASEIRFQVKSSSSSVNITLSFTDCEDDCKFYIGTFVNCQLINKYLIDHSNTMIMFSLPTNSNTIHEFSFIKLTEAHFQVAKGYMKLGSIKIEGGVILAQSNTTICPKKHKLLFIGDSFTAGYGNLGRYPCPFTIKTEDITSTYAFLVAQSVQADVHILPWSGKGMVRNYGDPNQISIDPMPYYYNRTLADLSAHKHTNYWNPNRYQPDIVIIMLGTNDYSTPPIPSDEQFNQGYIDFINQIKRDYPKTKILALCPPVTYSQLCPNIQLIAETTKSNYFAVPIKVWVGPKGCHYHPSASIQRNMANEIIPIIKELL